MADNKEAFDKELENNIGNVNKNIISRGTNT